LISTEWTGRVVTLHHPASARLYLISSTYRSIGQLLVLASKPEDSAVVLVPTGGRSPTLSHCWRGCI
jgi:hypothetical protein